MSGDGLRSSDELHADNFAIIPEFVLAEKADVVKLYGILDRYANKDTRRLWPGQAELAVRMECSDRHIRRLISRLEEIGALEEVKRRYNGTTVYRLLRVPPSGASQVGLGSPERPDSGVRSEPIDRTGESAPSGPGSPPNESQELEPKIQPPSSPSVTADVRRVFEAWQEATERPRAVLDDKRARLIHERLKMFTADELTEAVRGWKHSPHHRGENDRHTVYNDLNLLLRDAEHVERFRDWERGINRPANGLVVGAGYRRPVSVGDRGLAFVAERRKRDGRE